MVSHTYYIHLSSNTIQLPDLDDLVGKDVEVIVREADPAKRESNFDAVRQLLDKQANSRFFAQIDDPVNWQKQLRDEWE